MKKRKYTEIIKPEYLLCDICHTPIYNYELCTQPYTYCSMDCLEVLISITKNRLFTFIKKSKK